MTLLLPAYPPQQHPCLTSLETALPHLQIKPHQGTTASSLLPQSQQRHPENVNAVYQMQAMTVLPNARTMPWQFLGFKLYLIHYLWPVPSLPDFIKHCLVKQSTTISLSPSAWNPWMTPKWKWIYTTTIHLQIPYSPFGSPILL